MNDLYRNDTEHCILSFCQNTKSGLAHLLNLTKKELEKNISISDHIPHDRVHHFIKKKTCIKKNHGDILNDFRGFLKKNTLKILTIFETQINHYNNTIQYNIYFVFYKNTLTVTYKHDILFIESKNSLTKHFLDRREYQESNINYSFAKTQTEMQKYTIEKDNSSYTVNFNKDSCRAFYPWRSNIGWLLSFSRDKNKTLTKGLKIDRITERLLLDRKIPFNTEHEKIKAYLDFQKDVEWDTYKDFYLWMEQNSEFAHRTLIERKAPGLFTLPDDQKPLSLKRLIKPDTLFNALSPMLDIQAMRDELYQSKNKKEQP